MKERKVEFLKTWDINGKKFGLLKLPAPISPYNIRNDDEVKEEELEFINDLAESIKEIGLEQLPLCSPKEGIFVGRNRYFACRRAGIDSILVEIRDISPFEQKRLSHQENIKRRNISWIKSAQYCKELRGKCLNPNAIRSLRRYERSMKEISKITGLSESQVEIYLMALEVLEKVGVSAALTSIDLSIVREIHFTPEEDWDFLLNKIISNEIKTREELRKQISNANKMRSRIELLKTTHPKIAETVWSFWKDFKYEKGAYKDMEQEIAIRIKKYKSIPYYIPADRWTKEEAEQYAKEHLGEYIGTITKTWHEIYIVPYTIEELREKWRKKLEKG